MTWDINNFTTLSRYVEGGTVTFGDDSKGTIIGIGNIQIGASPIIENVVLVDGLKHNLLSISQLCDRGLKVIFDDSSYKIFNCILIGFRDNNVYIIDMLNLNCSTKCVNAFDQTSWLWRRRLEHASFDHLARINSKKLVKGIPCLKMTAFVVRANLGNKPSLLSNQSRISCHLAIRIDSHGSFWTN